MTLIDALEKLIKIKETHKNADSLRLVMADLKPVKKIKVFNVTRDSKFILVSDK